MSRRKLWGWGNEGDGPTDAERDAVAGLAAARFGLDEVRFESPPRLEDLALRAPRLAVPAALERCVSGDPRERAVHALGKSYRDLVRSLRGDVGVAPDLVAFPRVERDVEALLDWCADAGAAAIPFGGGTSVVGGVEPDPDDPRPSVSIDLGGLDRVLEVDETSRAARVQAGVFGPALEDALRPSGLTLRHYPQSFEFSTVGGWIATRSGGHHATLHTRIDDAVESLRVVTPSGTLETRRVPTSGAGPSPDRLFIGSEGILGVITEAWVRVQPRPRWRSSATVRFESFERGVQAARALGQSGLYPSNCRLLDPTEALVSGAGDGSVALLLVGFESADHPVEVGMARALELGRDAGGLVNDGDVRHRDEGSGGVEPDRPGAEGSWRRTFLRAPYLRDVLVSMGMITETLETSVTWDRFEALHAGILEDAARALASAGVARAIVSCRLTHVYPDGAAPYFTVIAPGRRGAELEQWAMVKDAVSEAILRFGGTITHHHAIGRDHRRWYERERPDLFGEALRAAKRALDPDGILNPGVLLGR